MVRTRCSRFSSRAISYAHRASFSCKCNPLSAILTFRARICRRLPRFLKRRRGGARTPCPIAGVCSNFPDPSSPERGKPPYRTTRGRDGGAPTTTTPGRASREGRGASNNVVIDARARWYGRLASRSVTRTRRRPRLSRGITPDGRERRTAWRCRSCVRRTTESIPSRSRAYVREGCVLSVFFSCSQFVCAVLSQ